MTLPAAAVVGLITVVGTVPLIGLWVWIRLIRQISQAVRWES